MNKLVNQIMLLEGVADMLGFMADALDDDLSRALLVLQTQVSAVVKELEAIDSELEDKQ